MIRAREGRAVLQSVPPLVRCPGSGCTAQGGSGSLRLGHSFSVALCGHEARTERRGGPGRSRGGVQGRGVAIVIPRPVALPPSPVVVLWRACVRTSDRCGSWTGLLSSYRGNHFRSRNHRFQASLITWAPRVWMNELGAFRPALAFALLLIVHKPGRPCASFLSVETCLLPSACVCPELARKLCFPEPRPFLPLAVLVIQITAQPVGVMMCLLRPGSVILPGQR